jgi:hypothetical protein
MIKQQRFAQKNSAILRKNVKIEGIEQGNTSIYACTCIVLSFSLLYSFSVFSFHFLVNHPRFFLNEDFLTRFQKIRLFTLLWQHPFIYLLFK